ncbi:DUF2147 domain-containing protein [Mucilaginibacter glaciei]|uniref:DUF2147 domain-containing protein n=1 Tax=Mucilaginibacter glaciei TaxID=2772109 RepID=A0A926S2T9_9SPHI|nr:DUF2147 domain-containing protein [Mucilaginibacter glaciei]MBD1394508.1 DUF2147 domain-containing protein [Mucilaginibacter glaciei]
MSHQFLLSFISLLLFTSHADKPTNTMVAADVICGKWQTEEKNLTVQVYKADDEFRAKIIWFSDKGDTKKMDEWKDIKNPDPTLRERKILGMNVLEKLTYSPNSNSWEDGVIYDAKNGRHWNSSAYIDKDGKLKVKGYWHFKFIGKTMTFVRI